MLTGHFYVYSFAFDRTLVPRSLCQSSTIGNHVLWVARACRLTGCRHFSPLLVLSQLTRSTVCPSGKLSLSLARHRHARVSSTTSTLSPIFQPFESVLLILIFKPLVSSRNLSAGRTKMPQPDHHQLTTCGLAGDWKLIDGQSQSPDVEPTSASYVPLCKDNVSEHCLADMHTKGPWLFNLKDDP